MDIKPIKNTRDYRRALKEIEGLMHAKRNTPAGDRLMCSFVLVDEGALRAELAPRRSRWQEPAQQAEKTSLFCE